ncbi:MAG: hypothetical protein PHE83_18170, partial [Opitutaceae bacterium]|nr:hypothetical protein [Opitutaceae bacterium]
MNKHAAPAPIPDALQSLYGVQKTLQEAYPRLAFTVDGKIIGDIGEMIAANVFGLEPLPANTKGHDLRTPDGRLVQVKATQ